MTTRDRALSCYERRYDLLGSWLLEPGTKVVLGSRADRCCRFCGRRKPEVTFKKVAHAVPESLGNKSIESMYECDSCNEAFGKGIENDLGNWSKPMRTFARVRGKSGVPTLKRGGDSPGWRIEYSDADGLQVSAYEDDPIFEVDEVNKRVTFRLRRDAYTPVGVLKAFMKIGLTLLPGSEVVDFPHLMRWVRDRDHQRPFADSCPIIYSFQPGPMPNDLISAFLLKRKPGVNDCPYMYFVLGYGNEVFQVPLPSQKHDGAANGVAQSIIPFPVPGSSDPVQYGPTRTGLLHLTGRDVVRGEIATLSVVFEKMRGDQPEPD